MIVHFIGSKGGILQEIDSYREIIKCIKDQGHTLARDWVEEYYELVQKTHVDDEKVQVDWSKIDLENAAALSKADIVIAEATAKSFFVGYQVAQAVNKKKPVLILAKSNTFSGVEELKASSDFIKGAAYTSENLGATIEKFIHDNDIQSKDMRFNFFIDRKIYNYLRWASFKTGKTKAEILRDLVENEIEKQEYQP